jgi:hypothetical protein
MKVIELGEAKSNLEVYARECQTSPVVVTIEGKPTFEMLPIRSDDPEFIDRLLATNQDFRRLMEDRRREADEQKVSTLDAVRKRIETAPPNGP